MKKHFLFFLFALFSFKEIFALHITGGEMFYQFVSADATSKTFNITLRLFRDDFTTGAALQPSLTIGVFNNDDGSKIGGGGTNNNFDVDINNGSIGESIPVNAPPPCLVTVPNIAYHMGIYTFMVTLPNNNNGYTIAYQTCCRVSGIANSPSNGGDNGSTYLCIIPGKNLFSGNDNSPQFTTSISIVCQNKPFTLDFSATDQDGDSLVYSLCNAYGGGAALNAGFADPAAPPYLSIPYYNGYSGTSPLGLSATINSATGVISGIAPPAGKYVVCVCVASYRNGKYITTSRKDFILNVSDCNFTGAQINPVPINCSNYNVIFQNLANNPAGTVYHWDFGVATLTNDTSNLENTNYIYPDTGVFNVSLKVTLPGGQCTDSTTISVGVYPGFFPKISMSGQCINATAQFTDLSTTKYGTITAWSWNFGDVGSANNTSTINNPTHIYTAANTYNVQFIVNSSKGCVGTIDTVLTIHNYPQFNVTPDTTICLLDTLQLQAIANGSFLWSPNYNINNINISNPLVSPKINTTYYVKLTDLFGCTGIDSVQITVVPNVMQIAPNDTTICQTDAIVLKLQSNALNYVWTQTPAANSLNNTTIKNPIATPLVNTVYHVVGSISGKCFATNDIAIKVIPYPNIIANNAVICLGNSVQLNATGGSSYYWTPSLFLNNQKIYNPVCNSPTTSIKYSVTVTDTLGCPKAVTKNVFVYVNKIIANAGTYDTLVALGQPLQLQASGGVSYLWSPSTWLSAINIANPISLPQNNIKYIVKVSDTLGCFALDSINVHLYNLAAGIYVPNAFTPNGDGLNDVFKPILIGIKSLEHFRVYNRWGDLVYDGTGLNANWDGIYKGKKQDPANFVWYAEGTDYNNNKIFKKGNVILIR